MIKGFFLALALAAAQAAAASAGPALILELGEKFDRAFNENAYNGAQRWARETGQSYSEFKLESEAQREQALRRFAEAGRNPIVMAGFAFQSKLAEVAADYPDTTFAIIDTVVDAPNVRSVVFKEHEGAYLVGVMAALASKTGVVGFVGGMDIPIIRRAACGYVQGAKAARSDVRVIRATAGTTPAAWADPVKGAEIARAQMAQGADVVFAAAGATGLGTLQAAADSGALGIGSDSNQNHLHPGSMLTSMTKGVDVAVYEAMRDGPGMRPGTRVMGVGNGGMGYAMDSHNAALVTPAMRRAVEDAAAAIADGSLVVAEHVAAGPCPSE